MHPVSLLLPWRPQDLPTPSHPTTGQVPFVSEGALSGVDLDLFRERMASPGKERGILKESNHMCTHFSFRSICGQSYDTEGGFDPLRTQTLCVFGGGGAAQNPVSMAPPGGHFRNMSLQALV